MRRRAAQSRAPPWASGLEYSPRGFRPAPVGAMPGTQGEGPLPGRPDRRLLGWGVGMGVWG